MPRSSDKRELAVGGRGGRSGEGGRSLVESVTGWVEESLRSEGYQLPLIKRIGFLVTGLLRAESARRGDLVMALDQLAVTSAEPESIARRVVRTLDDPRLDPDRVLVHALSLPLQGLLAGVLAEHEQSAASDPLHAEHFPRLRVIVDETSKVDDVHILVAGLGYQGAAIPLAIRTWKQNAALEPDQYRTELTSLLTSVEALLPPALRSHILLLADRAYGRSDFVDLLNAFGWGWILRIQGQTRIRLSDETTVAARSLVTKPGDFWCQRVNARSLPESIAAFKHSGWKRCHFVAAWAPQSNEPWLLVTNLTPTPERFLDYASRWSIERLFLVWKSHGWDIESLQMSSPQRLARYLSALALATIWTLVCGVTHVTTRIQARLSRCPQPTNHCVQPRLPGFDLPTTDHRSLFAKHSLISWGRHILHHAYCQLFTPPMHWLLPDWQAPTWSTHSQLLLAHHPL